MVVPSMHRLRGDDHAYGYDPKRAPLPGDLGSALEALEADTDFAEILGPAFLKTFLDFKHNELERFSHWVTDWAFREYAYHL
jgi:glutamine synthetase